MKILQYKDGDFHKNSANCIKIMSEPYIVSARKYRPQTFDTVVGQEHITTTLKNAIRTGHLAHAFLFCGPRGVGKTTCARILAKTINCLQPTAETEACGVCETCRSFSDSASFNVFELDAASNNSVDDIRALVEQVRFAPQTGKYKVYIIDEVHMLSSSAFNAFLKTLEEPPPYAIFILATTEKHKILPTILSRCQIFEFKRIQTDDIVGHLSNICAKEGTTADRTSLHLIAQKSEGCMRDALSMMDRIASFTDGNIVYAETIEHLNILDADVYFKLTDMLLAKDISGSMLLIDRVLQKGFEGDTILSGFAEHFRNLLLCKDMNMAKLLDLPEEHKRVYYDKARIVSTAFILSALNILNNAELNYRNALNKRLHVELHLLKLAMLNDVLDWNNLSDESLKKKVADSKDSQPISETVTLEKKIESTSTPTFQTKEQTNELPVEKQQPNQPLASIPNADVEAKSSSISTPAMSEDDSNTSFIKKAKIGKNLLQSVLQENTSVEVEEEITITQMLAEQWFREYIEQLKNEGQLSVTTQLSVTKVSVISADELQLIALSNINYHFAVNQKDDFVAYCIKQSHNKRLQIVVTLEEAAVPAPEVKHKSKLEIFEDMAKKNPALRALRDDLNLNIE